jgi:transposase-like protein
MGAVEVVEREAYEDLDLDAKVEFIRSLVPLGLMHMSEMLEDEVTALAGERYARKSAAELSRHGTNPGSVHLAGQRVPIPVPRVRGPRGEVPLRSYQLFQERAAVNDALLRRVLFGISCRNYEAAAEAIPGAIGLSSSSVSRAFVEASADELRKFQERDLRDTAFVALFLDGKTFAENTMVIALGVQASGEKQFLGFVETTTENASVLTMFLRSLLDRGLDVSEGMLVILDGGKGLRAAVQKAFARRALVQRCIRHKRENVVNYLPRNEQAAWRRRLQLAYNRPTHEEARKALERIYREHLLISPFAEGEAVFKSNFPTRNRVMATLSDATVIIEASDTSGTLHQAAECTRLKRWLFISQAIIDDAGVTWPAKFLNYERAVVLNRVSEILDRIKR